MYDFEQLTKKTNIDYATLLATDNKMCNLFHLVQKRLMGK